MRILLFFFVTLLLAPATFAQHDEVQALAHRMAIDISASGKKRLAVADFGGPGDSMTQLGKVLATELTASLAWTDRDLEASYTPLLQRSLNENGVPLKDQDDPRVARSLGEKAGAEIVLLGWIQTDGIRVMLRVRAIHATDGVRLAEHSTTIAKTQAVDALLAKRLYPLLPPPRPGTGCESFGSGVHTPGRSGISQPTCRECPNPPYTEEARKERVSGFVLLRLVVTEKGTPERIEVVNRAGQPPLGYGLEERAVEAVRDWRFQPATTREGKHVSSCLTVEIVFRIQ